MITYLIKSTLSLVFLYSAYAILLSRIKLFRFNRFILLFSVIFSLLIPFITLTFDVAINGQSSVPSSLNQTVDAINMGIQKNIILNPPIDNPTFQLGFQGIFTAIYFVITSILLFRFIKNFRKLYLMLKRGVKVNYMYSEVILVNEETIPFSFFNSIFISKNDYKNNSIHTNLIDHETVHVKQFHSMDIIFIELVSIFYWFNPLVYFFRKAIKLNHEYLADNYASRNKTTIADYSHNLIDYSSGRKSFNLTSGLNYSFIKRRINMLVRQDHIKSLKLRLISFIGTFIVLFIFIACSINSQNRNRRPDSINTTSGTYSGYRINDSTYYFYGDYTVISRTKNTKIKAHRLKLSIERSQSKNYFENDFLSGRVFTDGVDIYTNKLLLHRMISYKADKVASASNSKVINLEGNAEVNGEDLTIHSNKITLYLNEWKSF